MIIARLEEPKETLIGNSKEIIVLQFDRFFKKIIDGMICEETSGNGDDDKDTNFKYTHSFNNWANQMKKDSSQNSIYSFLSEDKIPMRFIQSRADKEKDEDDLDQEEKIRERVIVKTTEEWFQ